MKSLRAKMTILVLLLAAPFLIASLQGILYVSEQSQLQERKSLAKRSVNRLAKELRKANPRAKVGTLYEELGLDDLGVGAALVDKSGTVLWRSDKRAPEDQMAQGVQALVLDQGALLYVMPERGQMGDLRLMIIALSIFTMSIYGLGAWLLVGRTLKPIAQVVEEVIRASKTRDINITAPSSDREIVSLVQTMNKLIDEIRAESKERIDSYAALSHELRTPIQSLVGHVELALGEERSKEYLEESLVQVQAQVTRLNSVSEAVLMLQGLTGSGSAEPPAKVNLSEAVGRAVRDFEPLLELREVSIAQTICPGLLVLSRAEHLDILIRNLVHNAAKYADPRSVIEISADPTGGSCVVSNSFNGGEETELSGGNGLGLRICHAVARSSGWTLVTGHKGQNYVAELMFSGQDE